MIAGFKYNSTAFVGGYSNYFYHSCGLVSNMVANTLLQQTDPSSRITVYNHPFAVKTTQNVCDMSQLAKGHTYLFPMVVTYLSLALLVLAMTFISLPLKERVSKAKRLQLMTGLSPLLYWLTTFLCDLCLYVIIAALMLSTFFIFQTYDVYTASGYMGTLAVVFILFGVSSIAYAYFFSFLVSSSLKASVIFVIVNLISGTVASVFLSLLNWVYTGYYVYAFVLSFNPVFAATFAFTHLLAAMYVTGTCAQCGRNCKPDDPLQFLEPGLTAKHPNGILDFLILLAADAVIYFTLIFLTEYGVAKKLWFHISKLWIKFDDEEAAEDQDVVIEREKVKSSGNERGYTRNTVLLVNDLGKKYNRKTTAVQGVSFQVGLGECFGLLGVNGAGKTTTFKMLTGEEIPNKGDASVLQCSLKKRKSQFLSNIGYCPQFDAINKLLTARELLRVYAMLRGIPTSHINAHVSKWIDILGLKEYASRPCGTYSGGNKRKLSMAMAFIGEPPVVFLDEPTSGVDPVSRRKLWDVLSVCREAGQAVVLTSHSMEECEALCSRLTIMVGGQMKCIGTTEYLKHKFGQGYNIKIKLHSSYQLQNALHTLKYDMANHFQDCSVKDEHWGLLNYYVQDPTLRLSDLFTKMEHLKRRHDIVEDYSVSDTTLEQVFMSFARAAEAGHV